MMVLQPEQQRINAIRRRRSKGSSTALPSGNVNNSSRPQTGPAPEETADRSAAGQPQDRPLSSGAAPLNAASPLAAQSDYVAQLVLTCANNLLNLRQAVQIALCPPSQVESLLQSSGLHAPASIESPALLTPAEYRSLIQEFLIAQRNKVYDSDEEEAASSGDEDALDYHVDLREKYTNLREPLYLPLDPQLSATAASPMSAHHGINSSLSLNAHGKHPFNRRKIKLFDKINVQNTTLARNFIKRQLQIAKKNSTLQRLGKQTSSLSVLSFQPKQMTPSMAAALLLESLNCNQKESLEGMAQCYDGIVAAGVALTDGKNEADILQSLTPLIVTSLKPHSGQAILKIAQLRNLCGTPRYQRRFVQRIAPSLVRPSNAAMWCLRHQNDMEAVLAATELLLDHAHEIFRPGWTERGQALLHDSKRKETLDNAAARLRIMSDSFEPESVLLRKRKLKESALSQSELKAVNNQIRLTISNALRSDWSNSSLATELSRVNFRRNAPKRIMDSPKSVHSSPRSPQRKTPRSPPHMPSSFSAEQLASAASVDNSGLVPSFFQHQSEQRPLSPVSSPSITRKEEIPPKSPNSYKMQIDSVSVEETFQVPASPKRKDSATSIGTPLSPSSVGTAGSTELVSFKPSSAAAVSVGSGAVQYRTLTSTSAERKRTVAACRALRAQISRFEEAFFQMHGRPPKGAVDRAPLASTYAQYREWKRAIRADAACRIQALFRGAYTRMKLLRSNDPKATRVALQRAARPGGRSPSLTLPSTSAIDQPELNAAHIPESRSLPNSHVLPRARLGSNSDSDFSPPALPRSSPSLASSSANAPSNLLVDTDSSSMSLSELQSRKRELKQQLKQYDMNFARRHGRLPVKAEKEPIRHLYESYNALKSQISTLESEGRTTPLPSPLAGSPPPSPNTPRRAVSPHSGSDSQGSDDSPHRGTFSSGSRSSRNFPRSSSSAAGQDLASLKAEKSQLHQMLRTYEKDFFRDHRRQVSSFNDIRPVASQYRRYKEIKRAIASLQDSEG